MASYVHGTLETDSNDELFGVVPKYLFLMELGHIKEFLGPKGKYRVVIWRYGWKGIEDFYKVNVIF